jgi:hypothetical protein
MSVKKSNTWNTSIVLARAILYDRTARRRVLGRIVLVPLVILGIGVWVLQDWIWQSPWRALFWWGGCTLITLIVILFAIYDALAALREARGNVGSNEDQT